MHDPCTVAFDIPSYRFRQRHPRVPHLVTVWHVDPEKDGSDDSCGWFMRSRHGDQKVLERIASAFEFEWTHGVPRGWFDEDGDPNYSPQAITLGMFRIAANKVFGHWSGRADRFLRRHLFDILHFGENSCDSLYTFITRPYGRDKRDTPKSRALEAARIVYPWILRADRPWYRHPRWHVRHWRLQVHPWQTFRRWALSRCAKCGKGFRWGETPTSGCWDSPPPRWFEAFRGERDVMHGDCHKAALAGATTPQSERA